MKKRINKKIKIVFIILIVALLIISFVSAGLFDWIKYLFKDRNNKKFEGELGTLIGASEINRCSKLSNEIIIKINRINQENIVSGAIIFLNGSYWNKEEIEVGKSKRIGVRNVQDDFSFTYYDVNVISVSGGVVRVKIKSGSSEEEGNVYDKDSAIILGVNVTIFESYENKKKNEVVVKEGEIVNNVNKSYFVLPIIGEGGVIMRYHNYVLSDYLSGENYYPTLVSEGKYQLVLHGNLFDLVYSNGNYRFTWAPENEIDVFDNCKIQWCEDSDGGKNYSVKGVVKNLKANYEEADSCVCCKNGKPFLAEYYCDLNGNLSFEEYDCPLGKMCYQGVCINCTESWICTSWSTCTNGQQTRTCTDSNVCGTTTNKPLISESCAVQQQEEQKQEQKSTTSTIEPYIKNKTVSVEGNVKGKNIIKIEGESIETSLEIVDEESKIYIKTSGGNKELKILPKEAFTKAQKIDIIEEIKIKEERGKVVYSISGTKKVRLFFIFPITTNVEQGINIENGELVYTKKPWWHFLALGI